MRPWIRLVPVIGMAGLLLGGCVYRGDEGMGVSQDRDGYWGRDGAFYYSDNAHNWHRDDGNHFRHDDGDTSNWSPVHGSGVAREH